MTKKIEYWKYYILSLLHRPNMNYLYMKKMSNCAKCNIIASGEGWHWAQKDPYHRIMITVSRLDPRHQRQPNDVYTYTNISDINEWAIYFSILYINITTFNFYTLYMCLKYVSNIVYIVWAKQDNELIILTARFCILNIDKALYVFITFTTPHFYTITDIWE